MGILSTFVIYFKGIKKPTSQELLYMTLIGILSFFGEYLNNRGYKVSKIIATSMMKC